LQYYDSPEMKRILHPEWYKDPGCGHQYIFDIPIDHIIIDELHMMLRVTDRLEHALIYDAIDWDEVWQIHKHLCYLALQIMLLYY